MTKLIGILKNNKTDFIFVVFSYTTKSTNKTCIKPFSSVTNTQMCMSTVKYIKSKSTLIHVYTCLKFKQRCEREDYVSTLSYYRK